MEAFTHTYAQSVAPAAVLPMVGAGVVGPNPDAGRHGQSSALVMEKYVSTSALTLSLFLYLPLLSVLLSLSVSLPFYPSISLL